MPIHNNQELDAAVSEVGKLLQEIHDYTGRDLTKTIKIKFPRKFIRTADEQRARLFCIVEPALRDNIAYTLILSDVIHWLLVRTDLTGTARQMLIKLQLFLLGALIESITEVHLKGRCGKKFKCRTKYLVDHEVIEEKLKTELDWVWDMRNRMHLFLVTESEYESSIYSTPSLNRGVKAFQTLLTKLNDVSTGG
jgi:hypothetical protein